MQILQTATSHFLVMDCEGNTLGSIARQRGTTLWAFYKSGYKRPFKRDIPTLSAAKDLAERKPWVWYSTAKKDNALTLSVLFWVSAIVVGTLSMVSFV
jgi:hypothetical protein